MFHYGRDMDAICIISLFSFVNKRYDTIDIYIILHNVHVAYSFYYLQGAAKKERENKPRRCKPPKNDLLDLHSETQRLIRGDSNF